MRRTLVVAAVLAGLGGCTTLAPYETIPLLPGGDSRPRVGICFGGWHSSPEEVSAAAQDACGPGTTAKREDTDYGLAALQVCPALLPGRATFVCTKK